MPNDWVKVKSSELTWDATAKPLSDEGINDAGGAETDDPAAKWIDSMYGLMLGISVNNTPSASMEKYKCVVEV